MLEASMTSGAFRNYLNVAEWAKSLRSRSGARHYFGVGQPASNRSSGASGSGCFAPRYTTAPRLSLFGEL